MARGFIVRVIRRCASLFTPVQSKVSGLAYWEERVKVYGRRSVLNIGHSDAEMEAVTRRQEEEIFPHLRRALSGNERIVLDLGCGPGRFTGALASMIKGRAIGVDPIATLLEMAPKTESVEYRVMREGKISLPDEYVDVVWICLVLGGLKNDLLNETVAEIGRVLKKKGLLFVIENTSEKEDGEYWYFRKVEDYGRIFWFVRLEHVHDYMDLGERISVLTGRKT